MTAPVEDRTMTEATPALPAPLRGVRAAFVFLTRIPVGGFPYTKHDFAWASAHAPFVGFVVGTLVGTVDRLLLPAGALPAAFLALGVQLLLTGAFHEDGLADTADALGGAYQRERVLAILKDSRIGSFGGAALAVSIGSRAALLGELGARPLSGLSLAGSVALASGLARVGPIWLLATLPYVTPDPVAKSYDVARGGTPQAIVATLWGAAALVCAVRLGVLAEHRAAVLVPVLAIVTAVSGYRYRARVGGVTGDFLGATEQLCEIAALAVLAWST